MFLFGGLCCFSLFIGILHERNERGPDFVQSGSAVSNCGYELNDGWLFMRIMLCSETYLPVLNGVVTLLQMLKREWTAQGHEILIVAADHKAKRNYIEDGVLHCPAIKSEQLMVDLSFPLDAARFSLVKDFNPDIIHIQHEWGISIFGLKSAQLLGIPFVYTLHSEYSKFMEYAFKPYMIPWASSMLDKWERYILKHATVVTSPSRKGQLYFDSIGAKADVTIIQNGVELDEFDPELVSAEAKQLLRKELGIGDDEFVALFVGRMGPEKSVDMLLNCWARSFRSSNRMKLLLIGGGPDGKKLHEQAIRLGIDNSVVFVGKVPHAKIAPYYAISDVYVTASLSEMHSLSTLEGLAAGLPVLQRLDEPNRDQLIEGVNGWFFETEEEFADRFQHLLALGPVQLADVKKQVRESILETNSPRALANSYMEQYCRAIELYRSKKPRQKQREKLL